MSVPVMDSFRGSFHIARDQQKPLAVSPYSMLLLTDVGMVLPLPGVCV